MDRYGLLGYPLGHSFSARYFAEKFEREGISGCTYENFPLPDIERLPAWLSGQADLRGFNVTIPYKEAILPYLETLSDEARAIGAVNCVKVLPDGKLGGFNTDAYGFSLSLRQLIGEASPRALVLGTGGASKAVCHALEGLGLDYWLVSRSRGPERLSYEDISPEVIGFCRLIVNTTPLGTFPEVDGCPDLPYEAMGPEHFLFDLVYNPPLTEFLRRGEARGASVQNGYEMLLAQAERSWEIWNKEVKTSI